MALYAALKLRHVVRMRIRDMTYLSLFAAEGSTLFFAAEGSTLFFTSPFPVRELYAAKKSILGACTYGKMIRFMTYFDVTEMLKNIMTYSRLRFDFPNTLVETREQHCGP